MAAAFDRVITDSRMAAALAYLNSLNINAVPGQLDRISPQALTSIFTLGVAQFDTEVFSVQQRLADIRATPAEEEAPFSQPEGKSIIPLGDGKTILPMSGGKGVVPMGNGTARYRMPTRDQWGFTRRSWFGE